MGGLIIKLKSKIPEGIPEGRQIQHHSSCSLQKGHFSEGAQSPLHTLQRNNSRSPWHQEGL